MTEITKVFEDFSENVKKTVKNKPFALAAGGVALVALYVWWKKRSAASVDSTAYGAIGYAGYPNVSGSVSGGSGGSGESGSSDDSAFYEELIYENSSYYEKLLEDVSSKNNAAIVDLSEQVFTLTQTTQENREQIDTYEETLKRQSVISQMRANSELYNVITDRATKDALHAENLALAESMGWEFNPETGNYFEGNSVVYTTAKQQAGYDTKYTGGAPATSTGTFVNNQTYNAAVTESVIKASQSSGKGYTDGVDYSLAITQAKEAGADAATIKALQDARQAKINAVYGGVDPASKSTREKIK